MTSERGSLTHPRPAGSAADDTDSDPLPLGWTRWAWAPLRRKHRPTLSRQRDSVAEPDAGSAFHYTNRPETELGLWSRNLRRADRTTVNVGYPNRRVPRASRTPGRATCEDDSKRDNGSLPHLPIVSPDETS